MAGESKAAPPEPADIRDARERAGLTQVEAAALVHSTDRTWQNWESGAFKMAPGLWELFLLKVAQRAGGSCIPPGAYDGEGDDA